MARPCRHLFHILQVQQHRKSVFLRRRSLSNSRSTVFQPFLLEDQPDFPVEAALHRRPTIQTSTIFIDVLINLEIRNKIFCSLKSDTEKTTTYDSLSFLYFYDRSFFLLTINRNIWMWNKRTTFPIGWSVLLSMALKNDEKNWRRRRFSPRRLKLRWFLFFPLIEKKLNRTVPDGSDALQSGGLFARSNWTKSESVAADSFRWIGFKVKSRRIFSFEKVFFFKIGRNGWLHHSEHALFTAASVGSSSQ